MIVSGAAAVAAATTHKMVLGMVEHVIRFLAENGAPLTPDQKDVLAELCGSLGFVEDDVERPELSRLSRRMAAIRAECAP